jgi:hypothetical protein
MPETTAKAVYLAVDPGITTGWATWDEQGDIIEMGQVSADEFSKFFQAKITDDILHVIVEDYRNYAWKTQKRWSRNDTSKFIGQLEMLCNLRNIPITLQPASAKTAGYLWAGLGQAPSNHDISHQYDAVAHGTYWLQNNGIREIGKSIPKDLQ